MALNFQTIRTALTRYLERNISEPSILVVEPNVLSEFSDCWILLENENILNLISLAAVEETLFSSTSVASAVLCWDANASVRQVIFLLSTKTGEDMFHGLEQRRRSENKPYVFLPIKDPVFNLMLKSPRTFALTTGPCSPPSPFALNVSIENPFDLDLEIDLPNSYRLNLKHVASVLAHGISIQLELDISDQIFSMGFGASLLANTICRHEFEPSHSKASLVIVDRPIDWSNALDYEEPASRLHDQLIFTEQTSEIIPHILGLLECKTCSLEHALGLAVRAISKAGHEFEFTLMDQFSRVLNVPLIRLTRFFREIAFAKKYCNEETISSPSSESYITSTLSHMKNGRDSFPGEVKHAERNPFQSAAMMFNFLGTTSRTQTEPYEDEFRKRSLVLVFFLGGVSRKDESDIERVWGKQGGFLLGGTHAIENPGMVEKELFHMLQNATDFGTLF